MCGRDYRDPRACSGVVSLDTGSDYRVYSSVCRRCTSAVLKALDALIPERFRKPTPVITFAAPAPEPVK